VPGKSFLFFLRDALPGNGSAGDRDDVLQNAAVPVVLLCALEWSLKIQGRYLNFVPNRTHIRIRCPKVSQPLVDRIM
jgi:hypothetical protein